MSETAKKFLIILLDGSADWPCPQLGGKTPLENADAEVLHRLAAQGALGRLATIPAECKPGSEVANLCILSYDPRTCDPGRGVLEAASMGIPLRDDTLAMRANLVSFEGDLMLDHSAGHISSEEAAALLATLNEALGTDAIQLHPGVSYRHVLTFRGGSDQVACTPPHDILGQPYGAHLPEPATSEGGGTADKLQALMTASQNILRDHPVNKARLASGKNQADSLWFWSPGKTPAITSFKGKFGLKAAVISAVDLVKGIGRLAGMTVIDVPGATGLADTNYEGKCDAAVKALEDHDLVYVHLEGPDEAGHAGDPDLKTRAIQWASSRLIGNALDQLQRRGLLAATRVAVLPDHYTPCEIRTHHGAPVPFLIAGPGVKADAAARFTEAESDRGRLGLKNGVDFISLLTGDAV